MCSKKPKVPLAEVILAGVCKLQEKNGVTACEIAQYIAAKRGCSLEQVKPNVDNILQSAIDQGIICEGNGYYRIVRKYDDLPCSDEEQVSLCIDESDQDSDPGYCENVVNDDKDYGINPCRCLNYSRECLSEEEENRCGECPEKCPKKKKCK